MIATDPRKPKPSRSHLRHAKLLEPVIHFVPHHIFDQPDAAARIESMRPQQDACRTQRPHPPLSGLPAYLAELFRFGLLSATDERYLFCQMNYQLFLAEAVRMRLRHRIRPAELKCLKDHLQEALRIRNHIVQSNLRLVVSIAKRYVDSQTTLDELVSDGNLPLIRSVDLFDVSRGFRFSTYATNAIRNHLNRWKKNRQKHQSRYATTERFVFEELPDQLPDLIDDEEEKQKRRRKSIVSGFLGILDDRDQTIIASRFGLDGLGEPDTFASIGKTIGLSKERVRQLSIRAMEHLQQEARLQRPQRLDLLA